jgi:GT2 family glycosyltransferase
MLATAIAPGNRRSWRERFRVPRLAIVISSVGKIDALESTLVSVLENRPSDCEIVVALDQPYSDPYELKDEVRFVAPRSRVSWVGQVNAALSVTRAPFVHLLAAGCQVSEGWIDEALARFGDRQVGSVAPLIVDIDDPERVVAAGIGYRPSGARYLVGHGRPWNAIASTAPIVGPSGIGAFYRKAALDFIGGFSHQLGMQTADIDLALMLNRAGFSTTFEPRSRILAAADVDPRESAFCKALYSERLFWRNLVGGGRAKALTVHAGLVALEMLTSLPRPRALTQLAARGWATCQFGAYLRHHWALKQLQSRSLRPKAAASDRMRIDAGHPGIRGETAKSRAHAR